MSKLHVPSLIIFLNIVLSFSVFPQINPTEFPKIGYADMYWLKNAPFNKTYSNIIDYSSAKYYYPNLADLGLTHVVTFADSTPLNQNYNSTIKILDNNFARSSFTPFQYAHGTGNYINYIPYEVGGSNISNINDKINSFGFGTTGGQCSWWVQPYDNGTIGNSSYPDYLNGTYHYVHKTTIGTDIAPGLILHAELDPQHQFYNDFNYKLYINARIDDLPGGFQSDRVAHVTISEYTSPPPPVSSNQALFGDQYLQDAPLTSGLPFSYDLQASDFQGTNYITLKSLAFAKTKGTTLVIDIQWLGTRNLYIDKFSVADQNYEDLFITSPHDPNLTPNIGIALNNVFSGVKFNTLFTHLYDDEPLPMMYRAIGAVSSIAEQYLGIGKYINGATGNLYDDQILIANYQRRLPYVLYDNYKIWSVIDSVSDSPLRNIQNAFDEYINYSSDNVAPLGYPAVHRQSGLRQAINWAQNLTPTAPSDDIPLYACIQVQAEKYITNGQITNPRFRAPSSYEIMAEGNLSLCYGSKGIAYFAIMTNTPSADIDNIIDKYSVYGLFDESGNLYNDRVTPPQGIFQNPTNLQVPNSRFYAVKSLNQFIDRIKSELLLLTWTNGYTISQGQPTGVSITNISTNFSETPYVELGTFKKTDHMINDDGNLEYFYVVNRRTLSTEQRNITVTFNKTTGSFNNWKITEVGTANTWTVSRTGNFTATYAPGEGKLFRMEPVILTGGSLVVNEGILAGTWNINGSITVPSGITLSSVQSGTNLILASGSSISVNGILNSTNTTFTSTSSSSYWGGIRFNSGSSGIMNGCSVNHIQTYGGAAISISNCAPTIQNCTIENNINSNGICILGPCSNIPYLYNNIIRNNDINGIYIQNASAYLRYNTITGSTASGKASVYSYYYATPLFAVPSGGYEEGLNTLQNGYIGLWGDYYSNINAGTSGNAYHNRFLNNSSANVYATNYSTINAQYDWWGRYPADATKIIAQSGSTISYSNALRSDPLFSQISITNNNELTATPRQSSKNNNGTTSSSGNIKKALAALIEEFRKSKDGAILSYIQQFINNTTDPDTVRPIAIEVLSSILQFDNNISEAQALNKLLINDYSSTIYEKHALVNLFYIYFNSGDASKAKDVLKRINISYNNDEDVILANWLAGNSNGILAKNIDGGNQSHLAIEQKIDNYDLFTNYPNPFNPTTTIRYQIPKAGQVTLKIYGILGNEVATLVNESKEQGAYNITFDASKLVSGIYIYQIKCNEFTSSKKMMVLK
jgi:hypothetical protein